MTLFSLFKKLFSRKQDAHRESFEMHPEVFKTQFITPEPVVEGEVEDDLQVNPRPKKTIIKAAPKEVAKEKKATTKSTEKSKSKTKNKQ